MVRVISAHHFKSQDVSTSQEPCCSTMAGDLLLLASPLHQIEVRDLVNINQECYTFPTVDLVKNMIYSPVGRYLATLEVRDEATFVRIYINWWSLEAVCQPMRARIAGRVTPACSQEETYLEMIELALDLDTKVQSIDVCPSTGNLIVVTGCSLSILKYTLVSNSQNKSKFVDFQKCFAITLSYSPTNVKLVEDIVACLDQFQVHVFKVKILDSGDEKQLRSLSTYSFSSESESSMDPFSDKCSSYNPQSHHPNISNITARRRTDSSSERDLGTGDIKKHPRHLTLGTGRNDEDDTDSTNSSVETIPVPLVERTEKEVGCIATPRILEQTLGPCPSPPHMSVAIDIVQAAWPSSSAGNIVASAVTLVYAKIIEEERQHDQLKLLRLNPVYWREFRIKREKADGGQSSTQSPHNPLQSLMYSHLMSLSLMFTSVHEGYLYHIPGHIRRTGKGVGVLKIATYPFTCPVLDLVLEPSLLHALTETGLETYTLKSGYHTIREAEVIDDKHNTCPPTSCPLVLIGLRPFIGVKNLLLGSSRLVLVAEPSQPSQDMWTVYCLHLPTHQDLYRDMLAVAEINVGAPHGYLQMLSEAHIVIRTWLHRLTWLQVIKPHGVSITQDDLTAANQSFQESCIKLAEHYLTTKRSKEYKLAIPYFRLSKLPLLDILHRLQLDSPIQPGTLKLIEELVVDSSTNDSIVNAEVADRIISCLGERSLENLVRLVILSPSLRTFKSKQSLDYIENDLRKTTGDFTVKAEFALAAVLVGGTGDWLSMVNPVQLSETILKHYHLLFDTNSSSSQSSQTFSDLAICVRDCVPVIFVEMCVSLIESKLATLGQMLHLYLQTFMTVVTSPGQAADNAGVFQLFLETYFIELLSSSSSYGDVPTLEGDQQQALLTLVRSYLAGLMHPIPGPALDESMVTTGPEEMFGPRHQYLDHVPPLNTMDDTQQDTTLLKLQSLLCSPLSDTNCKETVLKYLEQSSQYELSLRLLTQDPDRDLINLIAEKCPEAMSYYCKQHGRDKQEVWTIALETLMSQNPSKDITNARESLLDEMAKTFSPEEFESIIPKQEEFQHYLSECRRFHQAAKLQSMIVATGHTLLETLAL